jgi:hypothetical protein
MDDYARANGHDPGDMPWIMIIHADGSSEFFRFEDEKDMWCCARHDEITEQLRIEIERARSEGRGPLELPEYASLTPPEAE